MNLPATPKLPIFIALDKGDYEQALRFALLAAISGCGIKLGLEFFIKNGAQGCLELMEACEKHGLQRPLLFLDLKLHDIPNTVAGAVRSALFIAPDFLTLHASGGAKMMQAAQEVIQFYDAPTQLVAVSLLTSMGINDMAEIGLASQDSEAHVLKLAALVLKAGLNNLVCAPHEIKAIRQNFGSQLTLITPGVRPQGADLGDQMRVMTPKMAMQAGANYLVIGRPITDATDPQAALKAIQVEISVEEIG